MTTLREKVAEIIKCVVLSGYVLCYNRREHWRLARIVSFFVGAIDYFTFEAESLRLWRSMRDERLAPFVHIFGGSSYGAFFTLREAHFVIRSFIRDLGITHALVAFHFGKDGRFDFHIVAPNWTEGGIPLHRAELLPLARQLMRRLINEINRQRQMGRRLAIANFTLEGTVVFGVVDLERAPVKTHAGAAPVGLEPEPPAPKTAPEISQAPTPAETPAQAVPTPLPPSAAEDYVWEQRTRQMHQAVNAVDPQDEAKKEKERQKIAAWQRVAAHHAQWVREAVAAARAKKLSKRKYAELLEFADTSRALHAVVQERRKAMEKVTPEAPQPNRDADR